MSNNRSTVLLVEDEPSLRKLIKEVLKHSFDVAEVDNGIDALKVLNKKDIDLVLLDLEIPELSGLSVLQKLREVDEKDKHKVPPVVVLTHMSNKELELTALGLGAVAYVQKDQVNMQELPELCRRYL